MQEHAGAGGGAKQVVVTSMMMAVVRMASMMMEMLMASRMPGILRQTEWPKDVESDGVENEVECAVKAANE